MFKLIKKLWRDRRGNAIMIAGAAMPLVVGAAGLATDTIQWVLWKRELQRAADSAAFAGVYIKAQSGTTSDIANAVCAHLNKTSNSTCSTAFSSSNNHTGFALLAGYPAITYPANDPANSLTNKVKVELRMQKRLGFSSLFLSTAPTITASATAAMMPGLSPCAIGLSTTSPSVIIGGSSSTNLGCPVMSDSTACPAVTTNGSAYNFISPTVAAAGCLPSAITGVTTLLPHYVQQPDPFAGKYPTALPAGCTTKTLSQNNYTTGTGQNKVNHLYSYETKGVCYSSFKFTGGEYWMDAGTYYVDSADFDTTGGTILHGTRVTIILTGSAPGTIKMAGNATITLSAPTTGTYAKMLFIQSSSASTSNNDNTISGDSGSSFDGAFYIPKGNVSFTGSTGSTTKCAMVIGWTLTFTGNTNLQNDTAGCTANTTATLQTVRLIA